MKTDTTKIMYENYVNKIEYLNTKPHKNKYTNHN